MTTKWLSYLKQLMMATPDSTRTMGSNFVSKLMLRTTTMMVQALVAEVVVLDLHPRQILCMLRLPNAPKPKSVEG